MNGFKLNSEGDIYTETYSTDDVTKLLRFARCSTPKEAIMRNIATNLRTELGEHFYDGELGVPWLTSILGRGPLEMAAAKSEATRVIREVDGVASVEEVSFDVSGRNLSISWTAVLEDGTTASATTEAS